MPIIRKIMNAKTSRAINLPLSWIKFFENELDTKIEYVTIEVDRELKILPYVPQKEK